MTTKRRLRFASVEAKEAFLRDLDVCLGLPAESWNAVVRYFSARSDPYKPGSAEDREDLGRDTKLPREDIRGVTHCFSWLVRQLALTGISVADMIEELVSLGRQPGELKGLKGFLDTIAERRSDLKVFVLRDAAASATIDTVEGLGFSIDMRGVHDDDDELTDVVPVLIVRMELEGAEERKEIVFQLGMDKLDQFMGMLAEQKAKLANLASRVRLGRGDSE